MEALIVLGPPTQDPHW